MAARTPLLSTLSRLMRRAEVSDAPDPHAHGRGSPLSRREFLARSTVAAGLIAPFGRTLSAAPSRTPRVVIVGAGLAGLACADRLQALGILPTIFEREDRAGGRCRSLRDLFPGQVAEEGGELIDNLHKTMLGYVNRFNLATENLVKSGGEETYFFNGAAYSEEDVIAEYRELVPRLRRDIKAGSGEPTVFGHTDADVALDNIDLETYLQTRAPDLPLIRHLLKVAYETEYGLDASEQSCLNLLLFIHADRRSKFRPWGVFSDERYHVVDGNERVVEGLVADFRGVIEYGRTLVRLGRSASGEYELWFDGVPWPERAEVVVLTLPFSVLREVELEPSLGLSSGKVRAINTLGYGTNTKTMIGFSGVPWRELYQRNGGVFSDLANLQNTWESNPARHGATSILTDYAAGTRGRLLGRSPGEVQAEVDRFLADLERVWPGVKQRAAKNGAEYLAHRFHWPSWPGARGSYTCYRPGQFTTIAGLEGQPAGHLYFAGEHTDSFYSWQGFMEGACLSGLAAADAIRRAMKKATW